MRDRKSKRESGRRKTLDLDSKSESVKSELPIVETPLEPMGDDIKPHSSIRHVSPVM